MLRRAAPSKRGRLLPALLLVLWVIGSNAVTASAQAPQACGSPFQPVVAGSVKTYAGTTETGSFTEVDTITDVGSSSFILQTDLTNVHWIETWQCFDDGMVQLMSDGGQWARIIQGPSGMGTLEVRSTSGRTIPLSINAGDSWSQETTFHFSSAQVSGDGRLTYQFQAAGFEPVVVPAGAFDAMRIDVVAMMEHNRGGATITVVYEGALWLAPQVGRVKQSGVTRLASGGPGTLTTVELMSYITP